MASRADISVKIGDRVRAWKTIEFSHFETTGSVMAVTGDRVGGFYAQIRDDVTGMLDWYRLSNKLLSNGYEVLNGERR